MGSAIAVVDGVEEAREDDLKALGAAAASSGAVAMFHMVGITPEAPTRAAAFGGRSPERTIRIGPTELAAAAAELTSTRETSLGAVSIGTPHFSYDEFTRLRALLDGRRIAERLEFFVSTGRDTLARVDEEGWGKGLRECGVQVVTDTCTYLTPILTGRPGAVMTNSAKWAWYAPNNLGYEVVFGSLEECVESAVRGEVWRDATQWGEGVGEPRATPSPAAAPPENGRRDGADGDDTASADVAIDMAASSTTQTLIEGDAEGDVLVLDEPLSFWGGVHEESGIISDIHHPQHGAVAGEQDRPDAERARIEFELECARRADSRRRRSRRDPDGGARPDHRARRYGG